jgi:acyl-CoA synthetase (AMP-forming)/AMP-acid ligase II
MLRSRRMDDTPDAGIPPYPPTVWALVERGAEQWSDHVLLADDHGRSLTGRELRDAAEATAAALATHGIGGGTVVSWQLPTTLETMVVMIALSRLGAVQNPLIPILREREVTFITNQVGTEVFITTERWRGFEHGDLGRTLAAAQGFTVVITDLDTDPTTIGNTLRLDQGDPSALAAAPPLDELPVRWIYTSSGTTADPKCVRHTDRTVMHGAGGPIGAGAAPDDVNAVAVPVSHIGGMLMLTAALMTGMQLALFEAFDPATSPDRMAAHGATVLGSAVPFFLAYFDAQQRHGDEPLFPRLRMLSGGGATTPPEISRRAREVLGVRGIANSWGLTEFPVATYGQLNAPIDVLDTTTGPAVAGVEVRTVTDDERVCAAGEEGELRLRGPQCFLGYVDASLDAAAFDDEGWFRTGDLGIIDADGNVTVTGRIKDIIIRNAENISALEIEDALYQHPAVADVAVVAAPDRRTGERVCAFVVVAPDAQAPTLQVLADHCRALGLAVQKCPEQLELVDVLPRNSYGKVLKQDLRKRVA